MSQEGTETPREGRTPRLRVGPPHPERPQGLALLPCPNSSSPPCVTPRVGSGGALLGFT